MDIVDQIVALGARDTLVLSLRKVAAELGAGEAGVAALQEIAEDNDCLLSDACEVLIIQKEPAIRLDLTPAKKWTW